MSFCLDHCVAKNKKLSHLIAIWLFGGVLSSVKNHILRDKNLGGEGAQANKELLQSPFPFTSETKRFALPSMCLILLRGLERCGEGGLDN